MISEKFVGRQPIFNRKGKTVAYELLFRTSEKNCYPVDISPNEATKQLISNSFLEIGIEEISSGKKVLINIDEESLHDNIIFSLPITKVNLEILETVAPTEKNINRINELKQYGFKIVLDDFVLNQDSKAFLKSCSLIKIDVQERNWDIIAKEVLYYKKLGKRVLAEKIETEEEFKKCRALQFDYFQGYFFKKPTIIKRKSLKTQEKTALAAYSALVNDKSYQDISNYLSMDLGLSERLLKYTHDVISKKKNGNKCGKVSSVYQALCFVGRDDILSFIRLSILDITKTANTEELIKMSFVRAKFIQSLFDGKGAELKNQAHLVGFFSLLDALLDVPLNRVLKSLNLHDDIYSAIVYEDGLLGEGLKLIKAIESMEVDIIKEQSKKFNIHHTRINTIYQQAIRWANSM